jgi:hypothetical protein
LEGKIDMDETDAGASRATFGLLASRARPAMARANRPMFPFVMRQGSDDSPNGELQVGCRKIQMCLGERSARIELLLPRRPICYSGPTHYSRMQ